MESWTPAVILLIALAFISFPVKIEGSGGLEEQRGRPSLHAPHLRMKRYYDYSAVDAASSPAIENLIEAFMKYVKMP
ncbi:hypothetical protein L596_012302 [Steinernema carpocapsae]|uniref:Uncharacterized protein n=1 Tax=Steinernema carpocapsae TaxID=34508 RepID=A0A4U5NWR2_STECR|nr:hypothetical protein L596_012302 [Steinernema carpocapsae]